ncbi:unnamed protein product [Trichobilharzia szidati]|nr:unnamed protein product [Trichobilharzia szidati]
MFCEKEIARDLRNFQKSCKEKRQLVIETYLNEEKNLNEEYSNNYKLLLKSHKKQLKDLHVKVEERKKNLRRKLENELKSEKKNLKKLYKYKSQSVSRLSELGDIRTSVISLDDSPSMQNAPFIENTNLRMAIVPSSTGSSQNNIPSNISNAGNNNNTIKESKKANSRLALRKHLSKSEYMLNSKNSSNNNKNNNNNKDSNRIDYDIEQIRNELEERFQCCTMDSRNSVAQMEWKCLLERQELRRAYLNNLGELKQRRIMSLGNLTRFQTKTYYDIQRKWLIQLHTHELNLRNKQCEEKLKRLAATQTIERQTACRLVKESTKGHKQMIRILEDMLKKDERLNKPDYGTMLESGNGRHVSVFEPFVESPPNISASDECIPINNNNNNNTNNRLSASSVHQRNQTLSMYSPIGITSVDESSQTSEISSLDYKLKCEQENYRRLKQSKLKVVEIKTDVPTPFVDRQHEEHQNENLRRVKSAQSIHSTISAYESLPKTILNLLTTRQSDLWTSVLEQEHLLTESLMKSHMEQLKALTTSENLAVKRCQMDFDNRSAYLSVTLEANQRFAEQEFAEERERMIRFYFGGDMHTDGDSHETSHCEPENLDNVNSISDVNSDRTEVVRSNYHQSQHVDIENLSETITLPVSSAIKKFEGYTNKKGQKCLPITFKPRSSSSSTTLTRPSILEGKRGSIIQEDTSNGRTEEKHK